MCFNKCKLLEFLVQVLNFGGINFLRHSEFHQPPNLLLCQYFRPYGMLMHVVCVYFQYIHIISSMLCTSCSTAQLRCHFTVTNTQTHTCTYTCMHTNMHTHITHITHKLTHIYIQLYTHIHIKTHSSELRGQGK